MNSKCKLLLFCKSARSIHYVKPIVYHLYKVSWCLPISALCQDILLYYSMYLITVRLHVYLLAVDDLIQLSAFRLFCTLNNVVVTTYKTYFLQMKTKVKKSILKCICKYTYNPIICRYFLNASSMLDSFSISLGQSNGCLTCRLNLFDRS